MSRTVLAISCRNSKRITKFIKCRYCRTQTLSGLVVIKNRLLKFRTSCIVVLRYTVCSTAGVDNGDRCIRRSAGCVNTIVSSLLHSTIRVVNVLCFRNLL